MDLLEGVLVELLRAVKACDRRRTDLAAFDPAQVRRILIISSTGLGDSLFSTPAIRAVREAYPHAYIAGMFHTRHADLFRNNPHLNGVIPYHGKYRRLLSTVAALRRGRFDVVAIAHGNDPDIIPLAYLSGARFVVRIPNDSTRFRFLLSNPDLTPANGRVPGQHAVEARLRVARLLGARGDDRRMILQVHPEAAGTVGAFLEERGVRSEDPLVGFQVGASTPSRMWFGDKFAELGRRLLRRHPRLWIAITGSPEEREYCRMVARAIGENHRILVTAGYLSLPQVAALVDRLSVLVSPDTGTLHMAVALGRPAVALYAMADSGITGPDPADPRYRIIQKWRTCDPCYGKACPFPICMENISVDEVEAAVGELLEGCGASDDERRAALACGGGQAR
jgi:ADP-heptose:LPS heptosyltransferase